ncbi:PstS family phosphate ABC transporter substrate-binding protein [Persicitalea jodogahamensis]|uniref:Phosphate ABC transporter substrate-binding protein n=1 Tax=Persicitalea jodogahamensis TaxID=402147 RepID=A0A8J3D0H1_9BACT|nr:substrate-binding domain-containing protein [Persicitalea jodogahamensis]GHB52306.1 phosphate ABC transporter substrate-binding protein [Persicitalea jodogahamensis]
MKIKKLFWVSLVVASGLVWYGCTSGNLDNPRQGTINVSVDESFRPLVKSLTHAYEGIYPDAHFNVSYLPEQEAVISLLRDSSRLAFTSRELNENEREVIKQQDGKLTEQKIAIDGIALITGKANQDSLITIKELEGIFSGRIKDWSQLKGSSQTGPITLVFDHANSSNLDYMLKRFGVQDVTKLPIYTAESNENVIKHVRDNRSSIGFIGVSWISDGDATLTSELSKNMRVMGVSDKENPTSIQDYGQPFQRDLRKGNYPLARFIYIISREGYSGLGGGLMTYIARDVGGLVIEKMGLVPTIPYPRDVEMQTKQNF